MRKACSFTNYFVVDPELTKINLKKLGCKTKFSEATGVTFLCDPVITWKEHVLTDDELFGG